MQLERFEQGVGMPIEEFLDILTKGFYYIKPKTKEIFWHGNDSIFVGNGFCPNSNSMIVTSHLYKADDNKVVDGHYWDWKKEGTIFNFKDYNKTWSAKKEVLEEVIEKSKMTNKQVIELIAKKEPTLFLNYLDTAYCCGYDGYFLKFPRYDEDNYDIWLNEDYQKTGFFSEKDVERLKKE